MNDTLPCLLCPPLLLLSEKAFHYSLVERLKPNPAQVSGLKAVLLIALQLIDLWLIDLWLITERLFWNVLPFPPSLFRLHANVLRHARFIHGC